MRFIQAAIAELILRTAGGGMREWRRGKDVFLRLQRLLRGRELD